MNKTQFVIIDDSPIDLLLSERMLKKIQSDAVVHTMRMARPALEWISDRKDEGELFILLDLQMPDMRGFEFLHQLELLAKEKTSHLTIAVVSSTFNSEEIDRVKKISLVRYFISKPLTIAKLQEILS